MSLVGFHGQESNDNEVINEVTILDTSAIIQQDNWNQKGNLTTMENDQSQRKCNIQNGNPHTRYRHTKRR